MRMRSLLATAASAVVTAGLIVATPTPAQAVEEVDRVSCRSNKNHYTDSDMFLYTHLPTASWVAEKVSWHTHDNFKPDRITWSMLYRNDSRWYVIASVGGSSSTHNDVAYKGSTTNVARPNGVVDAYRMTVYDAAFGDCSVAWTAP